MLLVACGGLNCFTLTITFQCLEEWKHSVETVHKVDWQRRGTWRVKCKCFGSVLSSSTHCGGGGRQDLPSLSPLC